MTDAHSLAQAQLRLAESRERLRVALGGLPSSATGQTRPAAGIGTLGQTARDAAASHPQSWLPRLAFTLGNKALAPTASRHPWLLVMGAASLGALLASGRPWRWAPPTLLAAGALRPWWQPMLLRAAGRLALSQLASPGGPVTTKRP